jgi:hypothetical protein
MTERSGIKLLASVGLVLVASVTATAGDTHDPNRTATIYLHGFNPDGAELEGVFGEDVQFQLLGVVGDMAGLPLIENGQAINAIAATTYYGDTPPSYYTAADRAELDAVTAAYGGGMPRYGLIAAKYARHVMDRTGASQVNIVSASMGTYVARWMIEHDSDGLASEGKIARWLSLEGVLSGNWAASNDLLSDLFDIFGTPSIDVDQMNYAWCEANLNSPRTEMDSSQYGEILVGMEVSSRDTDGNLTDIMLLEGDFHANDDVVTVDDAYFHTTTAQSRFLGHDPTQTFFHVNHYELQDHTPAMAQIVNFLTGQRRVTIELMQTQISDINEPEDPWWDWTPAEIVFTSSVVSPQADDLWGITEPMCNRPAEGVTAVIHEVDGSGDWLEANYLIFDDFLAAGERVLHVTIGAVEIDDDQRYDVWEPLIGTGWDDLGSDTIVVDVSTPGVHSQSVNAPDFNGTLRIEVIDYPFPELSNVLPGDVDGDGTVGVDDLLAIIAAWGSCGGCSEDINGDGFVDVNDLLAALAAWTA